ncbi:glycerophosphoryl diester phosphodiesterase, putative [Ricinus communis]|uniref:glycerophosphodiester phosphodiesterase n=1 Tax=Ricinus communis TaxID=3988 RepID=B9SSQ8_RICCO|nr:glycerophosphoryl diester phosphodiesterase, putative [Ricinus communis]|eukprot:XP_002529027.1 glycerophosphodiester phosphodiesterase GDPDL3 [Ricinus communis]
MSGRRDSPAAMWSRRSVSCVVAAFVLLNSLASLVSAQGSGTSWKTLSGNPPLVIARGGFSGIFPDSSSAAYQLALITGVPDLILWCDVQLTKDGVGICAPDLRLDNSTDISLVFKNKDKNYLVNGAPTQGWFSVDFTFNDLSSVVLTQGVYSRSNKFDGNLFPIQTVENVTGLKPPSIWLNIQHDAFFTQHNLSMRSYVLSLSKKVVINYISSPEMAFLRGIASRFNPKVTKLVFRFLGPNEIEPSTNQTYSALSKNLTFIKTFASGILIPKGYIWPVDASLYLQPHTSVVSDAHKAGLEVFASEFYNDVPFSFNYSYDPISEYLSFVDNGDFSIDGVLSDFPITPSGAFDCFSQIGQNATKQSNVLVISKNGASGDYPGCTDMAYQKAISDGADVIDCPVQMSKDGIPFCLSTINLIDSTKVAQTNYGSLAANIPELEKGSGIYTFNLTWSQIQTLTPAIANPYAIYKLFRNPKFRNAGKFLTLSDFLALAKNTSSLSGVLISIEHAAYLIEKQQLPVTDAVLGALSKAGYENQTAIDVMIQSTNSAVLMKFKDKKNYKLVYKVDENIRDALDATIEDIRTFANSVVVNKNSVFPDNSLFLTGATDVVPKLQSAGLPVYVELFSNEFVSQAWDFFSDANVEINSYVIGANVSGVITDFPKTAARYKRNKCLNMGNSTPAYMAPVQPGSLLQLITQDYLPPAEAPNPVLTEADVAEAPLPPVKARGPSSSTGDETRAAAPVPPNGQHKIAACFFLSNLAVLFSVLVLL